jgi:hypothetical protein
MMDIKSVGLGFNHVQSTAVPESPVQDQSSKPQVSGAQTAPNQPIETISNLEKNSRIGQMKLEGSLQQANLNMVLDAQPKAVPPSAQDVTNPAEGIVKNEDPLPQVIESEFMDAVNAGIAKGRAEYLHDQQGGGSGSGGPGYKDGSPEDLMKKQYDEMFKKFVDWSIHNM